MECILVAHTHWDREWYRTFEFFRARLVDTVDRVLDLIAAEPDFHFLLDGQTIVLEDYLEIRPERRSELETACRAGRIAIGPWYVQPDSILPAGETHIRNLLEGRRVGETFGGVSRVAYTPDSFGHPAQLPQILAGFGLGPFVFWRGVGDEIERLGAEWTWAAPDGSTVAVHHLAEGYFGACGLPTDSVATAAFLEGLGRTLAEPTRSGRVLFMNGIDHAAPQEHVGPGLDVLRRLTGWRVRRGLLEDFVADLDFTGARHCGPLLGGRIANLLPGVWSTRTPLKIMNRRVEATLSGWAEPFAAIGHAFGLRDERPALRRAWRALLANQAHDSICGCSLDEVHRQGEARYATALELAHETTRRSLERLAGLPPIRSTPWSAALELAVFNPNPEAQSGVVTFPLDPDMWLETGGDHERSLRIHPLLAADLRALGFTADGAPARLVPDDSPGRVQLDAERPGRAVQFVARDVPAFGWKRVKLEAVPGGHLDEVDDGRSIGDDDRGVAVAEDGTLSLWFGGASWRGLCGIEDLGDRGDSYDFDPVLGDGPGQDDVVVQRRRHACGISELEVTRRLRLPAGLQCDRDERSREMVAVTLRVIARIVHGMDEVELSIEFDNQARDHRLRLLFPTGGGPDGRAATTFDVAAVRAGAPETTGWVQSAVSTFAQGGFVEGGGLLLAAPGLVECELFPDGTFALTLVRSVGWLARMDLRSRPMPAGPIVATPGAQCQGPVRARMTCLPAGAWGRARAAELGLCAVAAGPSPIVEAGRALLEIGPAPLRLEAFKQRDEGEGFVVRLLNPLDCPLRARLGTSLPVSHWRRLRLDETALDPEVEPIDDRAIEFEVGPHALVTVELMKGE